MPKVGDMKQGPLKILIYGPSGTGKTGLALTIGAIGQIIDLDLGVETALGMARQNPSDPFAEVRKLVDHLPCGEPNPTTEARAFELAKTYLIAINNAIAQGKYPYKVLIVDSFTLLADAAMRYILKVNGRLSRPATLPDRGNIGGGISQPEWGLMIDQVEQFILLLRGLPIHVILLAHSTPLKNDNDSFIRYEIAIPTKRLPPRVPAYFDELWFLEMQQAAGNSTRRKLRTNATTMFDARSRAGLPDGTDVNIGMPEIFKLLGREL